MLKELIKEITKCIAFGSCQTIHTFLPVDIRLGSLGGFGTDGWDIHPAAVLLNSMLMPSHENKQCMTETDTSL